MAITLIVNNTSYDFPEQGEQAPWGEQVTNWAREVTNVLNSVSGPSDILESSATINNNVTSFTDIPNFFFDATQVRSFAVRGNIYRSYGGGPTELAEEFLLCGLYRGAGGWVLTQEGIGDAGVEFEITPAGQVQYKSSNLVGAPYSGIIKFRGVGILNT